jgi:hypothetical protein
MSGICSGFVTAAFILILVMVSYLPLPDDGQLGTYLRSFFVYRYRSCTINAPTVQILMMSSAPASAHFSRRKGTGHAP